MKRFNFTDSKERETTLRICRQHGITEEDYILVGLFKSTILVDNAKIDAFNTALLQAKKLLSEQNRINEQVENGITTTPPPNNGNV